MGTQVADGTSAKRLEPTPIAELVHVLVAEFLQGGLIDDVLFRPSAVCADGSIPLAVGVGDAPEEVGAATRRVLEIASERDLVLGTGSLSVAAEVIEEMQGMNPEIYPNIKMPSSRSA